MRGDGQGEMGLQQQKTLKPKHAGPFIWENASVNCNAFTAAIALNKPCIVGHHYSEETYKLQVIADCSPAPKELDEG